MPDCPLPLDVLPKQLQKHADPKAPPPLRMMGAKGLVPAVAPVDLFVTTRATLADPFTGFTNLTALDSPQNDTSPAV